MARTRIREAAFRELHRDPYRPEMEGAILARVPADLDALMEHVTTRAATRLGFRVEQVRGSRTYAIEFGNEALVDSLPGLAAGASFVGSFDREYAVADEAIDFFGSGHPLVEGLLAHYEDGAAGRVAFLDVVLPGPPGIGIVVIYKEGPVSEIVALNADGRERPDWAAAFQREGLRARKMREEGRVAHDWPATVQRLAALLPRSRRPYAVAAMRVISYCSFLVGPREMSMRIVPPNCP